jgi:hypothetical protein
MSTSPFLPADDPRAGTCATCGAPFAADQRYCLSCGARRTHARLPFQDALVQTTPVGPVGPGGAPPALWYPPASTGPSAQTMLAALACVLLAFGVGILVGGGNDDAPQQPVVLGAGAAAPVAAPTTTTTEEEASADEDETASADAEDDAAEADASDTEVSEVEPAKNLDAEEKKEAEELKKIPAKVPKAKEVSDATLDALNSKDPDKAREASNSLPNVVSSGD